MEVPPTGSYRFPMNDMNLYPGYSLTELILVVALTGMLIGLATMPMRPVLDRYAVRTARDALATAVARTRATAVARGGAILVVEPAAGTANTFTIAGDPVGAPVDLGGVYRVKLSADGRSAEVIELYFDGLGIGRVANRTFRFRRGEAEAGLTLSSYGRVRVW